jgi:hypothetical protein
MRPAFLLEYKIHCPIFRLIKNLNYVKLFCLILLFSTYTAAAQLPLNEEQFLSRLKTGATLPEKILSTRSVVFYPYNVSSKELESIQTSFQRTGIDAVLYFENDYVSTGRDAAVALAAYLNKREITNLIYIRKDPLGYSFYITLYNQKANLVENEQPAWMFQHRALDVLLQQLYRTAANSLKKENYLINDFPETGFAINGIDGARNEFFAIDLKVDELAVPKFGDENMDRQLEEIMKAYPYKYKLTEPGLSEAELRKQGFLYVLRFMHARNRVLRNVLGYDITRAQTGIVSITFTGEQQQLNNFSVNEIVYKFYFKHIESQNVFLGTKWDADPSWQQALTNQLQGFRIEFKLN